MGELDRMSTNNTWIWVILAYFLLSNNCGVSGILDEFKCSFGNLFSGNNWILIAVAAYFLFFNKGLMC